MISETTEASCVAITLEDVLKARDARAKLQQEWLFRFEQPMISTTLVWPGAVKDTLLARQVMAEAKEALGQLLRKHRWEISRQEMRFQPTGPEAFWSVSVPAWMIKHVTVHLEDSHPLGRLWDIDVFCPKSGLIKRSKIRQPMRQCFICDEPAHVCSRMRRHSQSELAQVIEDLTYDYFSRRR
ncbi:citrate lyase holo-[acyl-carrier protein] synthase [Enterobacillus tribolii]|uniref:Apo-citrate lyase phosphoribosyl-dephospho-CoA transferase n=1 Tax=Enterobacillus tribolii TaxID=1487935 RepID=A0A370QSE9_9GAMM|nr:citrate lyase holo-[acyl-carrier protein] synthase [Enterobacillus tribolii]MBW7983813.1 citrate lyase holo-[acyl-carrier protein] synthase [Enterobacillus tribolii]RDK92178.1 holo-ACP synthase [Enterobacillus tribolii]